MQTSPPIPKPTNNKQNTNMKAAIARLEISLETLTTNEPIHRAEGNIEQADMEKANIAEIKQALAVLKDADTMPPNNTPTPRTDEATLLATDLEQGGNFNAVHVQVAQRLEEELAAVTEQRDGLRSAVDYASDQLTRVTEQRDRLAEALQKLNEYDLGDIPVGVVRRCEEALAAVKGGSDES